MAKLKVFLEIEDAKSKKEALELAQEVIAMLKVRFKHTEVEGKVKLACPDCGQPMTVEGREIVCPACEAEIERDFRLDDVMKALARRGREVEQSLESLLL